MTTLFEPLDAANGFRLQALATTADAIFNDPNNRDVAFAIVMFPMGEPITDKFVHVSNVHYETALEAMKKWIEHRGAEDVKAQNQAAALSELQPLISAGERKVLMDRRMNDSNDYQGEERRQPVDA